MKYKIHYPNEDEIKWMNNWANKFFGEADNIMVEPTLDNALKTVNLDKNTYVCFKNGSDVIGWSLVLPASKNAMKKFLKEELTEKELFLDTLENKKFETLYVFAAIVMPEYRNKGLAKELLSYQIKYFKSEYEITDFFAWTFSEEGKKLVASLERELNIKIPYLSKV